MKSKVKSIGYALGYSYIALMTYRAYLDHKIWFFVGVMAALIVVTSVSEFLYYNPISFRSTIEKELVRALTKGRMVKQPRSRKIKNGQLRTL